ncbi:MAG TPA: ATP-dependent helicase HrpB [bacterium]|nr:ATP-dependent helicase HrpB [bacterium]
MIPLPIDAVMPQITGALARAGALVLEAPPGAGKTTRVPPAILDAGLAGDGRIVVLQPRRLAARLAAARVAEERGEKPGETVGWQVRFEDVSSAKTRIKFVTEGVLTRRLLSDPTLAGVNVVVLDEFHERHLDGDVALALLRRLQRTRPELKLVVMSATLDAGPIAAWLDAPRVTSEGRRFDVSLEYLEREDDRPLAQQVAGAVKRLVADGLDGDVLVFLPGAAEIRRAQEACAEIASSRDLLVLPLHGDLPPAEQDRAVKPAARRKIILSTNVAETSVTIDGVVAVVDSGLARIASLAPWSGIPRLAVAKVSRASAAQRAGRAGRTRPGRCLRLYTKHDHDTRPAMETPEIRRLDLAETALSLHASGIDPRQLGWFEAPPTEAVDAGETLLERLGAIEKGAITERGRRLLRYPVHPRLARLIAEADARGAGEAGCLLAALLSERDVRGRASARAAASGSSDLLEMREAFLEARRSGLDGERLRARGFDPGAVYSVERVRAQLVRSLSAARGEARSPSAKPDDDEEALLLATLAAYPDRVARRKPAPVARPGAPAGDELALAGGGAARLAPESVVRDAAFLVAVDIEERRDVTSAARGFPMRGPQVLVRVASQVEPEWLLDLFPERVAESVETSWVAEAERVDAMSRLTYDGLVLEESRATGAGEAIAARLREEALSRGPRAFAEEGALDALFARVAFLREHAADAGLPALGEAEARETLGELCEGRRSFSELREASLIDALKSRLAPAQVAALDRLAPERLTLPGGRSLRIGWEAGKPPHVSSRLQDFFGMAKGPVVAAGRVPVVLHLLAPNQRDLQITTDLAGFWDRHYPAIRKELMRKYPRHSWPEDPRTAAPPPPKGPRR